MFFFPLTQTPPATLQKKMDEETLKDLKHRTMEERQALTDGVRQFAAERRARGEPVTGQDWMQEYGRLYEAQYGHERRMRASDHWCDVCLCKVFSAVVVCLLAVFWYNRPSL